MARRKTVAVAAGRLCPTAAGLLAGVGLATAVPLHRPAAKEQRAGIRVSFVVPQIAIPAGQTVASDAHIFHRPVGQSPGVYAHGSQTVDTQMGQVYVRRILGIQANGRPISKGRVIALAGQVPAVELDASRVVGDLQAGELDVAGVGQVDDEPGTLGAPQLGRVGTASVPAGAEDAGGVVPVGSAGNAGHVTVESAIGLAFAGVNGAIAHAI